MGMETNGLSVADALALQRNGDGMFGGDGASTWVFFLFFLLAMNNGSWGGRNGVMDNYVLNSDFATLQRQIDSGISSLERKGDTINAGLCDGFYAMNTGMLNGFSGVNQNIMQTGYQIGGQISALSSDLAQCCCTTQRNIDSVRYENAQNTTAITNAIHAEGEQTRALLTTQENMRLRDELAQARDALSNQAQSRYILGQIGQYYTNPPCYGNNCGCNNGCGC